jgi:hypothetical protein
VENSVGKGLWTYHQTLERVNVFEIGTKDSQGSGCKNINSRYMTQLQYNINTLRAGDADLRF